MSTDNLLFTLLCLIILVAQSTVCQDRIRSPVLGYQKSDFKLQKCVTNKFGFIHDLRLPNTIMANNESTHFRLENPCDRFRNPPCHKQCPVDRRVSYTVPLVPNQSEFTVLFTPAGFLRVNNSFYHRGDFCVSDLTKDKVYVEACKPICGENRICAPKCCSADKVIDINRESCEYSLDHLWKPVVYKSEDVQVCGEKKASFKFHYTQQIPQCSGKQTPHTFLLRSYVGVNQNLDQLLHHRIRFRMLQDGSVVMKGIQDRNWIKLEQGQYCLDGAQNYGSRIQNYSGDPTDQVLLACPPDTPEGNRIDTKLTILGVLYCVLLFSGTPFLLITVIVYLLLWNKQNIHGWTLFSHTLAMLLNYMGQGVTNIVTRVYDSSDIASANCKVIGILNHYFVLSSFCWMTMINYDLWSMFRHLQSTVGRSRGVKRFIMYSTIAWGIPAVVVLTSVILDSKYGVYGETGDMCENDHIIIPLYGFKTCFMVEEARPFYIFYPIGTLMMINLLLAGLTFYNMSKHKKNVKMVSKKSTKHKRKFSMWSKLFVVMGVAYTSEVAVWSLKEKDGTLPWYLVFPDVIGLLQAIAIFVLFACQPKIINQLNERYPSLQPFLEKILSLPCYGSPNETTGAAVVSK